MSAKVEGLPGILQGGKRTGMKSARANAAAGILVVLMPCAPESSHPRGFLHPDLEG